MDDKLPLIHLRLKLNGNLDKIRFFHTLLSKLDCDWPWGSNRRDPSENLLCSKCGGFEYRMGVFNPIDIRALAKQINECKELKGHLKVRIKSYIRDPKCALPAKTDQKVS